MQPLNHKYFGSEISGRYTAKPTFCQSEPWGTFQHLAETTWHERQRKALKAFPLEIIYFVSADKLRFGVSQPFQPMGSLQLSRTGWASRKNSDWSVWKPWTSFAQGLQLGKFSKGSFQMDGNGTEVGKRTSHLAGNMLQVCLIGMEYKIVPAKLQDCKG